MEDMVNKKKPYVLFLDAENVGPNLVDSIEEEAEKNFLFISERRAYERSNKRIASEYRKLLAARGYTIIDIGSTDAKDAVDTAIKRDMWSFFDRYKKHMVLVSRDGGFHAIIEDIKRNGGRVFVPKMKDASKKLKCHSKQNGKILKKWAHCKNIACSAITREIKKLESDSGQAPWKTLSQPSSNEIEIGKRLIKAVKKDRSVCIEGWIYFENLSLIVGNEWACAIWEYMKRNAGTYGLRLPDNDAAECSAIGVTFKTRSSQPVSGSVLGDLTAKIVAEKYRYHIPMQKDVKKKMQIKKFLMEMMAVDDSIRLFVNRHQEINQAVNVMRNLLLR